MESFSENDEGVELYQKPSRPKKGKVGVTQARKANIVEE